MIKSERGTYLSIVANLWNKLADRCPDLALQTIERPGKKKKLKLNLMRFTAAFREEFARFSAALGTTDAGDLYDDLDLAQEDRPYRPSKPLKPSTVQLRLDQIIYAASALVHAGVAPEEINGLADLFTPTVRVKTTIRHLRDRGAENRSSHVEGVVEALRHAARFCRAEPQIHAKLKDLKKNRRRQI